MNNDRLNQQMNQPQPVGINCDVVTPVIIEVLSFLVRRVVVTDEEKQAFVNEISDVLWSKIYPQIKKIKEDPNMSVLVISGEYNKFVQRVQTQISELLKFLSGSGGSSV